MRILISFVSGFLAVLLFHQPVLWILGRAGMAQWPAYSMRAVPPLGVPAFLSAAFWGGVWGVVLWLVLRRLARSRFLWGATLFGAFAPTLVAGFIILPLRGQEIPAGGAGKALVAGLLVNAAWGLGTALLILLMGRKLSSPDR